MWIWLETKQSSAKSIFNVFFLKLDRQRNQNEEKKQEHTVQQELKLELNSIKKADVVVVILLLI